MVWWKHMKIIEDYSTFICMMLTSLHFFVSHADLPCLTARSLCKRQWHHSLDILKHLGATARVTVCIFMLLHCSPCSVSTSVSWMTTSSPTILGLSWEWSAKDSAGSSEIVRCSSAAPRFSHACSTARQNDQVHRADDAKSFPSCQPFFPFLETVFWW